jgi:hypothetical protein
VSQNVQNKAKMENTSSTRIHLEKLILKMVEDGCSLVCDG